MKAKRRGNKDNQSFWKRTVIIQLIILLMFFILFKNSIPCDAEQLQQTTIVVEEKTYFRQSKQGYHLICSYQTNRYRFPNLGIHAQYSNSDLHNLLTEGDQLTITYFESYSLLFGKHNYIVSASKENTELRTYEEYYKRKKGVSWAVCVLFGIIEVLFLGYCFIDACRTLSSRKRT